MLFLQYLLAVAAMLRIIKMHQYLLKITCVAFSEGGLLYRTRTGAFALCRDYSNYRDHNAVETTVTF